MSITTKSLLIEVKSNLAEIKKFRYVTGTATSGSSTSIVSSTLANTYPDDTFNGCFARLTSGSAANFKRVLVSDFTGATFTVTLAESIGFAITTQTFEIFDRGLYDDPDILQWLNTEQIELAHMLTDEALTNFIKRDTTSGTTGFAAFPTDFLRNIQDAVEVGENNVAPIYKPSERMIFADDAFIPGTTLEPVAIYSSQEQGDGSFLRGIDYKPANNLTVYWNYVAVPADMTLSGNMTLPDACRPALVAGATARALMMSEDMGQAGAWLKKRDMLIQVMNGQSQNRTRQDKQ